LEGDNVTAAVDGGEDGVIVTVRLHIVPFCVPAVKEHELGVTEVMICGAAALRPDINNTGSNCACAAEMSVKKMAKNSGIFMSSFVMGFFVLDHEHHQR
jgi:hypothetical protein